MWYLLAFLAILPALSIPSAYGQEIITVNQTTPCFLNYTAGIHMPQNCGIEEDYLAFAMLGWEWITGGYFSMILVAMFTMFTYIKYHKMIYPIIVGVMFLPISFFLFPDQFVIFAILMAFVGVGIMIWYVFVRQTKEWSG